METSLRYNNLDNHLLLHAKEKFLLDKSFFFQVPNTSQLLGMKVWGIGF